MERKSSASFIRCSARKLRLVADLVRGKNAKKAEVNLRFVGNRSSRLLGSVLRNALSNAESGGKVDASNLFVKSIMVGQGPYMKRWIPRARGSATKIMKKTSHIELVLEER